MSSYDYENSHEQELSVFDADLKEVSLEYLAENTDDFASNMVYAICGAEAYEVMAENNEVRIMAVKMASRFLEMMLERAKRQESHMATVNFLNDLL
ncbi:hypothetical protein SCRES3_gp45 [Synechococcus phage S-CRES3]|nr:hypothetical protein SCRES3_gp45 [Synechococcus phage S-CRES3]